MPHESNIEQAFIDILAGRQNQWTYRNDIKTESALWKNLRGHINRINVAQLDGVPLTDDEFVQIKNEFRRLTQTPFSASQWLRGEQGIAKIEIEREEIDKDKATLTLFSNKDIAGGISSYEVVNQVEVGDLRGDVTLLINGLPLIHIELKSDHVKDGYWQAFHQTRRYAQSGFFNGIYSTVQICVISNKASTKYFARPSNNADFDSAKKFLFNWREPNNTPVEDLYEFTRKVLSIPMAHELVSKFTILVDDKKEQKFMMVLRPYQIHAIKKIRDSVAAHEGGFVWHATGSGKTITCFVATKLLAQSATGVARTVMIVDRKDLDSQTKNEFGKFASEYNTGQASGNVTDNTLIVGINNKKELVENFVSQKNNNTIIITTIQKLSRAIRETRESESKSKQSQFDKLKGDHIVFIVDECHRAVSDKEMREIKKIFPRSTWIGFTGTPIFEENQKEEVGTFARTTYDQYGQILHAYTTKNAMDDKSVLDFQVEYHSLMNPEEEQRAYFERVGDNVQLKAMPDIKKEALLGNNFYEDDDYIKAMLRKIFRHQSVLEKFKVVNGLPTMSGILTTHSIAQAKRIYAKLMDLKKFGELITGNPVDERRRLNDPDFPRVAITYSIAENEDDKTAARQVTLALPKSAQANRAESEVLPEFKREIAEIIKTYNDTFGTSYDALDIDRYNNNINNRLTRKDAQYKKDGQWLDLVIVVDRLLTGFDAPTIQALYVDRELRYHKLLQAFSRTNRNFPGKSIGMIVTFRKPATMAKNVRDSIKLFSNEERDWENLVPKEYKEVKKSLKKAHKDFVLARQELEQDPTDLKKRLTAIKAFQTMAKTADAIKSYEEFENEFNELSPALEVIKVEVGSIENLKAEVKIQLQEQGATEEEQDELLGIEFSAYGRATLEETIDSYYIYQLLKDIKKPENKQKFDEIIESKPEIVKDTYTEALNEADDKSDVVDSVSCHFKAVIDAILTKTATTLKVPAHELFTSFNEFSKEKGAVPYINEIVNDSSLSKDEFERIFEGRKYRERRRAIEEYWRQVIETKLLPLKEEIAI